MLVLPPASSALAFYFHRSLPLPLLRRAPPLVGLSLARSLMAFSAGQAAVEDKAEAGDEALPTPVAGTVDECEVSHEEWRRWGTSSLLPSSVATVVHELLEMEAAAGEKMRFGGVGSKLKVTSFSSPFLL